MSVTLDYIRWRRAIYNFVRGVIATQPEISTSELARRLPAALLPEAAWHDRVAWANNTLRCLEKNGELRSEVRIVKKRRVRCYMPLDTQKAEAT